MTGDFDLSAAELASLREIAKGVHQAAIPASHAARLLAYKLIYRLLGDLRITADGRKRLVRGG